MYIASDESQSGYNTAVRFQSTAFVRSFRIRIAREIDIRESRTSFFRGLLQEITWKKGGTGVCRDVIVSRRPVANTFW